MSSAKAGIDRSRSIKVVPSSKRKGVISLRDEEMDARAVKAVRAAVEKAKFCKKPVAKYDVELEKAYIEYPDGVRKYVD